MSESYPAGGSGEANFYEPIPPLDPNRPRKSFEELAAQRYGGDPVEWIPEAEALDETLTRLIERGGSLIVPEPEAETEGVFQGYHKIKVYSFDPKIAESSSSNVRIVYGTREQIKSGKFSVPTEGLFVLDKPEA